jgi:hypothetical protein
VPVGIERIIALLSRLVGIERIVTRQLGIGIAERWTFGALGRKVAEKTSACVEDCRLRSVGFGAGFGDPRSRLTHGVLLSWRAEWEASARFTVGACIARPTGG